MQLWATGVHEARMVAALVADPAAFSAPEALLALEDRTARWIARDALRELRAPATVARIKG
jgi:3-methyladenine DNA glycosylase AlkD